MDCAAWARQLMVSGAAAGPPPAGAHRLGLRLVVQGGLRILDKVDALQGDSLLQRPTVGKADLPRMLWRALAM
jgi:hypothetical protein